MIRPKVVLSVLALLGSISLLAACAGENSSSSTSAATAMSETTAATTPPTAAPSSTSDSTIVSDDPPPEDPANGDSPPPPADLAAEIDELVDVTERLRGLEFLHSVDVAIQQDAEFDAGLLTAIDEDLDPELLEAEERVLVTLGLIGPDEDLEQLYRSLLVDQVLGYYDPESKELVVRDNGGDLSPNEKSIVVHELVHALTDQYYDWGQTVIELADGEAGDRLRALQMVGEGDATRIQTEYAISELTPDELSEFLAEAFAEEQASADLNPYLLESLSLPYVEGFEFMVSAPASTIEALYETPPASTEQIMESTDELPIPVELPALSLDGYSLLEEFTQGQGDLQVVLSVLGSPTTAPNAARGWGGDRAAWYWNGQDTVAVYRFVGDQELDATELADAHRAWIDTRSAAIGYVGVEQEGNQVDLVVASDQAMGPSIWEQLAG